MNKQDERSRGRHCGSDRVMLGGACLCLDQGNNCLFIFVFVFVFVFAFHLYAFVCRRLKATFSHSQTWNLSNVLHQQDSQFCQSYPKTHVNSDIFGNKLKMEDVLLLCLVQIVGVRRRLSVFVQLC